MKILIYVDDWHTRYGKRALGVLAHICRRLEIVGYTTHLEKKVHLIFMGEEIPFVERENLILNGIDYVLVLGNKDSNISSINKRLQLLNTWQIILDRTICIPEFSFQKYKQLHKSKLSILANNCWGGQVSHRIGLPFLTPLINTAWRDDCFLNFLNDPRGCIEHGLEFIREMPRNDSKYPLTCLGKGVEIDMIHETDFQNAKEKWDRRAKRINWYNLLVVMYTERKEILEAFDELPYGKKVCFVPFESDCSSAYYIDPYTDPEKKFWMFITGFAEGKYDFYNLFDMMLYGKKTPLVLRDSEL